MQRLRVMALLSGIGLVLAMGTASSQELSTAEPVLKELAAGALDQGKSKAERLEATRALGEWGTGQVVPALLALLDDPDPAIRTEAARGLGWQGNGAAVTPLLARLKSTAEDPAVRAAAAASLGKIGAVEAREALLAGVTDPDSALRLAAIEALAFGHLGSEVDRVPVLIALLKDEHQPLAARGRAAQDLGEIKDPRAFDVLLEMLQQGPRVEPVPFTYQPKNRAETYAARSRLVTNTRAWSAQSLGQLGDPRAVPALVAASEDPEDYFLREMTLQALLMLKAPAAAPAFLKALGDPFPPARYTAIRGLATLKVATAVDPLIALLTETDPQTRLFAVAALGEIADPKAREPLAQLAAGDPEPRIREVARQAIARLRGAPVR